MKKIFRMLSLLMIAVLVFTGCAIIPESKQTQEPQDSNQTTVGQEKPEELVLPISATGLKLTVFSALPSGTAAVVSDYSQVKCFVEMEKRTGVKLEFIHPPQGAGQENEKFNLMMASNDLPDLIYTGWASKAGGPQKFAKEGQIISLNQYVSKYAPNFSKLLESNSEYKKQVMDDNGDMYYFPLTTIDSTTRLNKGFIIRNDWVEKLGLELPTTTDDFYNILKAFRERDPNENELEDEIPFVTDTISQFVFHLVWPWGISWGGGSFSPDFALKGDKIVYGPIEPEAKEALAWINKLYNEKLIDPDFSTSDRPAMKTKVTTGLSGVWYGYTGAQYTGYLKEMETIDPNFELATFPTPIAPGIDKSYNFDPGMKNLNTGIGIAITSQCKNIKEAVKWLDYAYSDEGILLYSFGIEGDTYNMVNGNPILSDAVMKDVSLLTPAVTSINGWAMIQDPRFFEQYTSKVGKENFDRWGISTPERRIPQQISYTTEENRIISTKLTDIKTLADEMFYKFVMGREPLSEFDKFVDTVNSMDIDELIKVQQSAYERYNNR